VPAECAAVLGSEVCAIVAVGRCSTRGAPFCRQHEYGFGNPYHRVASGVCVACGEADAQSHQRRREAELRASGTHPEQLDAAPAEVARLAAMIPDGRMESCRYQEIVLRWRFGTVRDSRCRWQQGPDVCVVGEFGWSPSGSRRI
jgi:hypothetical protein